MSPGYDYLNLLVIEDNEGDFVLVSEAIEEIFPSCSIDRAPTFESASTKRIQDYHLVLLDLTLPDKSGEELIKEILRLAGKVPVVVLTGYVDRNFAIKSIALGMSDYLVKDEIHPDILSRSIVYSIERKKVFNRLEQSELRYRELFHLSPLPMWVYDQDSLRFLDVNEAAIQSYGYSRSEFLSMTIADIRPEQERKKMYEAVEEGKAIPGLRSAGTFLHTKKNGQLITVEISSNRISFDGVPAKLVLANDVTQKKAYIRTVEQQNRRLRDIAWVQSHVVRAPLARLMGLVNLLEIELSDLPAEKKELLNHIVFSADELDDVIKDINEKSQNIDMPEKNN
ncbi:PAS domain S-box-containing protein [Cyclobacterium xiamenense]|uniref:histidine kinase n=1 Tax=Cyclobacterium xiamenense TaxID=1297121 RepID=A0A1H7B125_9BACT|nr:PAS domain S-box protein [Cyclobacterium xiamenense]SEJ71521.1 PAS domain S-box-containing protein [Cyclobacterium xiamenense]